MPAFGNQKSGPFRSSALLPVLLACSPGPPPAEVAVNVPGPASTAKQPPVSAEPKTAVRDPDRALDLANDGDRIVTLNVHGAIEKYLEAIELDPDNPILYWKLGHAYYRLEDFESFAEAMQKSAELDPKDARYPQKLAFARARLAEAGSRARWPGVLEAASACLALDPARHECDYTAGLAQQALGKYPEAESNFRKAIAGNAENGRYHVTLASLLVEQRRFADARVALGAASRDVPMVQRWKEELFSLRMLSAEVARAESDAPAAIDALEQATAIAGDAHPEAAFELGKAYADLTPPNTEKATRLFRHFIKRACRGARRAELQAQCVEAERRLSATP